MADISSFLSDGQIPAQMAYKSLTSQTVLPDWYTNYAMQLLSNQQAQMATPYQAYQGPRVAEFSPAQQQAFAATGQAANAYQPMLGAATTATQGLLGQNALGAAKPYFSQAAGMSGYNVAQPFLNQGQQLTQQSTQVSGLQAAQPMINQAGQKATNVSEYMDPYISQVVNRVGELGARTLREQLMPEIEGRYIRAGQLGFGPSGGGPSTPSGMMTDTARALRDVQGNVLAQQAQLMSQGYGQAQSAAQADLARQAQLAATAGNLGTAQQQALAQAGQQMGALGQIGGNLMTQQQDLLAQIGAQTGALGGADLSRQLAAAGQLGDLGASAQQLGLTGAGALANVGTAQQAQAQKNLDTAYGDFLRQQGYNQQQINNALATFQGVAAGVPKATVEEGIVPTGNTATYQPGTAETVGSVLSGIGGVLAGIKGL